MTFKYCKAHKLSYHHAQKCPMCLDWTDYFVFGVASSFLAILAYLLYLSVS